MTVLLKAQREISENILNVQWETKWRQEKVGDLFSLFISCLFARAQVVSIPCAFSSMRILYLFVRSADWCLIWPSGEWAVGRKGAAIHSEYRQWSSFWAYFITKKARKGLSLSLTLSDSMYIFYSDDVTSITCMLLSQKRRRWFFFWHGGITFICQNMFVSIILYTQHAASSTHVAFVCHGHHFAEETIVGDTRNTIYEKDFFFVKSRWTDNKQQKPACSWT